MSELAQVLRHLVPVDDANALVGAMTGDDAAVYRLSGDRAVVVTADFFTPIVDDPFDFGRIAAANALSDIYAMGARPLFGLNLVGFPRKLLHEGLLEEILRGGGTVCRDAGIPVLGGHSIDDAEPKFGMVAVGEVHPDCLLANDGAQPGDVLVLTKPIGTGIVTTAIKADAAPADLVRHAIEIMASLNKGASEAMGCAGAHAATDVTGFGLLGHLRNMLRASGVSARVRACDVPLLPGVEALAEAGHVPGGTGRNQGDTFKDTTWSETVPERMRVLLNDAQTSGGLLISTPADGVDELLEELEGKAPVAAVIGAVVEGEAGTIEVL
jgi:selenide,water dikinase